MTEVYLSTAAISSVPKKFDSIETLAEAGDGFDGVQIYLDSRFYDREYRHRFAKSAKSTRLGLIVHLPDRPNDQDLAIVQGLVDEVPRTKVLVHYGPLKTAPKLENSRVGFENSVSHFDPLHIWHLYLLTRVQRRPFVFDYGRSFKANDLDLRRQKRIIGFTRSMIKRLNSGQDIIHAKDKRQWSSRFRETMCPLGQGISGQIVPELQQFNGIVVLEHTNLQMARESIGIFKGT